MRQAATFAFAQTGIAVSKSYIYNLMKPRNSRSREARRHHVRYELRTVLPQRRDAIGAEASCDEHFAMALVKLQRFGDRPPPLVSAISLQPDLTSLPSFQR